MGLFAINEMTTYRWSFEEDVHRYVAAGISGIGVWRQKLADFGEEKGILLLQEHRLEVSALLWAGGFTGSDGRTYRESIEDAIEAIRLAADLRAGCLVVYSGGRGGHTGNHCRRLFKGALAELLPIASEFNVKLAIEPIHAGCAAEWTFLTGLDETLGLIDEFRTDQLQLVFDSYHLGGDANVLSRLPELSPRIGLVQLGDAKHPPQGEQDRCRLGEGTLPLREIVVGLSRAGYAGSYEIELMGEEIELQDYVELVCHSKQVFDCWRQCGTKPSE
jgi:sugar phosphate isomerase/epimerase